MVISKQLFGTYRVIPTDKEVKIISSVTGLAIKELL